MHNKQHSVSSVVDFNFSNTVTVILLTVVLINFIPFYI